MYVQSLGVNVYHGVGVDFEISEQSTVGSSTPFSSPKVLLNDSSNTLGPSVRARMVCDASGFSRRLTAKFGEKFATISSCPRTYRLTKRYPTLDTLLTNNYKLLPNYYGDQTYFVKKTLAYISPVVAGEGWLVIGNSAGFTNPMYSPGVNAAGLSSGWTAANLTAKVLAAPEQEAKGVMMAAAKSHQAYLHDFILTRLANMNRLWYNAFRDHRLFKKNILEALWASSYENVEDHYYGDTRSVYTEYDAHWLMGAGLDAYQALCAEILPILDGANAGAPPSEDEVQKVLEIKERVVHDRMERWTKKSLGEVVETVRREDAENSGEEGENGRLPGGG
ncbi:hypothetical protein B0H16DRAFT_1714076 [Mycena metata]|uniref:Uncharacterized protein n=1 Tax=Mycena metata TaxID=1033252 RepID=A0AAD7JW37_9AGAR|nr:hypothetical protein B0H16DRAFT_1714076 [Mycena metata]